MKKQIFKNPFAWIVALLLLGGIGYGLAVSGVVDLSRFSFPSSVPPESKEFMAQVNGEGIQRALFEIRFEQRKNTYEAQGTTLQEKDIALVKQQMLDDMINEILLIQYGKERGIAVADETIESEYQKIAAQFPSEEEFQKHIATQKATLEDVRSVILLQLIVQQIIDQKVAEQPIEISEDEMRQVYDKAVAEGAEIPPFEEVKLDIENQLRQQKIGELMNAFIDQLRREGTIEILG
ncbi:MAG: SurA N-terminal domain-containing protein [Patescibacteria group bacterium]